MLLSGLTTNEVHVHASEILDLKETNEDGKDVVVGGYEYQIFDTIADKLKYVVFMYECI